MQLKLLLSLFACTLATATAVPEASLPEGITAEMLPRDYSPNTPVVVLRDFLGLEARDGRIAKRDCGCSECYNPRNEKYGTKCCTVCSYLCAGACTVICGNC